MKFHLKYKPTTTSLLLSIAASAEMGIAVWKDSAVNGIAALFVLLLSFSAVHWYFEPESNPVIDVMTMNIKMHKVNEFEEE